MNSFNVTTCYSHRSDISCIASMSFLSDFSVLRAGPDISCFQKRAKGAKVLYSNSFHRITGNAGRYQVGTRSLQ